MAKKKTASKPLTRGEVKVIVNAAIKKYAASDKKQDAKLMKRGK